MGWNILENQEAGKLPGEGLVLNPLRYQRPRTQSQYKRKEAAIRKPVTNNRISNPEGD